MYSDPEDVMNNTPTPIWSITLESSISLIAFGTLGD